MAIWTASLDSPIVVETPNCVAYVTFSSDDGRSDQQRVPFFGETTEEADAALLAFLADQCIARGKFDERMVKCDAIVVGTKVATGPLTLPDRTAHQEAQAATMAYQQQLSGVVNQKIYDEAVVIDPTLADAKTAMDDAVAATKP